MQGIRNLLAMASKLRMVFFKAGFRRSRGEDEGDVDCW